MKNCPYCSRKLDADQPEVCDSDDCPRHDIAATMAKNNLSSEQWDALTLAQQITLMEN